MAIKLADALVYLGADDDKLKKDLNDAEAKTKGWGATMTGVLQGVGMGIAGAVGSMISGVWDTVTESITLASDMGETVSKIRTLFGDSAAGIEEWAATSIGALRLTSQETLDAIGTMGNMFMQMGVATDEAAAMSQSMVTLAADIASFHNVQGGAVEVSEALQAAYRGEYDSLQRYIPLINAAAVEQRALADTGKSAAEELTAQDKAMAVYKLTIEGAGAAVGDAARTSDSFAGAMTILNKYWTEFKTLLGETVLPLLTPFIAKIAELANQWLPVLADFIHTNIIPAFEDWANNFDSWWADHGQPFIEDIQAMWDGMVAEAAAAMGVTKDEFTFSMDSIKALAGVIGADIGSALGTAITTTISTQFQEWAATVWPRMVQGLIDNVSWLAMLQQLGVISGPMQGQPQPAPGNGGGIQGEPNVQYQTHIPIVINAQGNPNAVAQAANSGVTQALRAAGVTP